MQSGPKNLIFWPRFRQMRAHTRDLNLGLAPLALLIYVLVKVTRHRLNDLSGSIL